MSLWIIAPEADEQTVCSRLMAGAQHYIIYLEILYLEASPGCTDRSNAPARWNWCRVRAGGDVVSEGLAQDSLAGCYSAVKRHMTMAGDAAIKIDLTDAFARGNGC